MKQPLNSVRLVKRLLPEQRDFLVYLTYHKWRDVDMHEINKIIKQDVYEIGASYRYTDSEYDNVLLNNLRNRYMGEYIEYCNQSRI